MIFAVGETRGMQKAARFAYAVGVALAASGCGSEPPPGTSPGASTAPGSGSSGGGVTSAGGSSGIPGTSGGSSTASGGSSGSTAGSTSSGGSSSGADAGARDASAVRDASGGGDATTPATTGGALIQNDVFWKDTAGNPITSQGGGVLQIGNTFYWYGVRYHGAVTYAASPTGKNSDTTFDAVTCYSSTDLVHWKFENDVLVPGNLAPSWLGRMGVAYNKTTQTYVLVTQYTGAQGSGELFATSSTPTGAFAVDHVQATLTNVVNGASGDQSLFVDDDGQAYLVLSSSNGRANLYVAPLRPADFLSVDPATRIGGGPGREGNCMFKYNGRYYFNSSDLHGWNASHTYTISAANILGPYSAEIVMPNTDADFSHVSQTGFFITVHGMAASTVIFAGDRWSDFAGNGLGYNQWVPLTFNGTTPQFQSLSQWSIDAAAGTWAVGPGNNYALNPSFEADRVTMTQPAGWTTATATTGETPYTNLSRGHTGNWKWRLTDTVAYQATVSQVVTGLPDGTYTLAAWMQSSGGQSVARLFARDFGGAEKDANVTSAIASWSQVSIPGIVVSGGSATIGVETTAGANQWVDLDDVTFVKN
jgi:Glycosyl hydrolases family 43